MEEFLQHVITQFQQTTWLEWLGTISGFLCVWLAAKQHILNWPVAIISILAYTVLFYQGRLYGDSALQLYFLGTSVYGWVYWSKNTWGKTKAVTVFTGRQMVLVVSCVMVLFLLLSLFLDHFTDTDVPYADGFCTAVSFVAQVLLTRKVLQNWILWIIVDICYIPLYLYKDFYLTAVLYTLYLVLATMGYINWKKTRVTYS
jgi:nicotinamide mononucleotide transporter